MAGIHRHRGVCVRRLCVQVGANMRGVDLENVELEGADLTDVVLEGAMVRGMGQCRDPGGLDGWMNWRGGGVG